MEMARFLGSPEVGIPGQFYLAFSETRSSSVKFSSLR